MIYEESIGGNHGIEPSGSDRVRQYAGKGGRAVPCQPDAAAHDILTGER